MQPYAINPDFAVTDEQSLRGLFGATHELATLKTLASLDEHAQAFIQRSPFICLGTQNADGTADVSPRGDPAGFVKILDPFTLAIPDRPGNNRLDSLANIVSNPNVGLLFIVPGFDDTLRVNGKATLVTDPDLLASMSIDGRAPKIAIVVKINEVFLHCAKAFRRSHLWDPNHFQNRSDMPSLIKMILDQTSGAPADPAEQQKMDADLEEDYRTSMY